jgi:Zn-dependent peptidase ImmA (M78 family)
MKKFKGCNLRVARLFAEKSLDDVAAHAGKTRQYIHKLEVEEDANPTDSLADKMADFLAVERGFFFDAVLAPIHDQNVHFRKQFTTRALIKHIAIAKAEMFEHVVSTLDRKCSLPDLSFPDGSKARTVDDIERVAESFRSAMSLGQGPITNMTRLAESCGAVVTTFAGVSEHVDALSVSAARPIIVRNDAKRSPFRQRFDIAHEVGHLILHQGVVTGDHRTEGEANRFASALMLPRAMMLKFFPRPRGRRLSWVALAEFKRNWKVSKAAILYRARQLDLLSDDQYRTGVIHLTQSGQAREESEDKEYEFEVPEIVRSCVDVLYREARVTHDELARQMNIKPRILESLGIGPSLLEVPKPHSAQVIPLPLQR